MRNHRPIILVLTCLGRLAGAAAIDAPDAPPAADSVVAHINGKAMTYVPTANDIDGKLAQMQHKFSVQLQQLKLGNARSRSEAIENRIEDAIDQQVLALEAAARKTTPAALLQGVKAATITDEKLHAFFDSQQAQIGKSFDEVSVQLRQYLEKEAAAEAKDTYLRTLRKKYRARVDWEPLREVVETRGPQRGPDDAAVTIVEFSDFQCPFCGRMVPVLRALQQEYPTQVRLIFRNMPLIAIHPNAQKAAEAAMCADAQGKFWVMHDLLYAEQNSLSVDALKEKAKRLELDQPAFDSCLTENRSGAAVRTDLEAGEQLGIVSTPSSFLNGRYVSGALPLFQWRALVEDELARIAAQPKH